MFYTGCNVLKTPHIALLALDIMDTLGVTYRVMGGPTHCCGIIQMRTGDVETSGRMAENTMDKLAQSKTGQVLSWCPSCHVQFTEVTLPNVEKTRGRQAVRDDAIHAVPAPQSRPRCAPTSRNASTMRVALHRHPGIAGVVPAAEDILRPYPASSSSTSSSPPSA